MDFNFDLKPDKLIKNNFEKIESVISIILDTDSDEEIDDTVNSILSQTYPNFELLIIINDSKKSLIDKLKKLDSRIKIVSSNKEKIQSRLNEAEKKSSKDSKYLVFIQSGDLIERTFLENLYWSLETNPDNGFCYSNYVIYGEKNKLVNVWFNKKNPNINILSLIRKDAFEKYNGFDEELEFGDSVKKLWKEFYKNSLYPVSTSYYLTWIKDKNIVEEYEKNNKSRTLLLPKPGSKTCGATIYPKFSYNYEYIRDELSNIVIPIKNKDNKTNILMIVPWIITGGADIFNLELIKRLPKDKYSFTFVSTEPSINNLRQQFENICDVYDLPSFLDRKNWVPFLNYLIKKNNINLIFNTSSLFGYSCLPYFRAKYPEIPIVDYVHMEEWYNRNGGYARSSSQFSSIIDKTWVCNSVTENIMKDYFHREDDEVKTVYIGVDTDKFDPAKFDKDELKKKYNVPDNKFIISYICRISEQKRPMLLAEIMKKTLASRNDILFLIVGDGSMLKELKGKVNEYGLSANVKFLPSTNNTPAMYRMSDCTINCSIKEGLALTAYESLAMGVPVISADVGGQRELVSNDVGRLVPCMQDETEIYNFKYNNEEIENYVKAIDEVVKNANELKKNCRPKILNKFTLPQMAENMDKEFQDVIAKHNQDKIENGQGLTNSVNICKELIIASLMEDGPKTEYQTRDFMKKVYNVKVEYIGDTTYSRKQKIKERLWRNPLWRALTKTHIWKLMKKIVRR